MQQSISRSARRKSSIVLAVFSVLLVMLVMTSFSFIMPAAAQDAEPTATPNDPIWRAFDAARKAVEEEHGVNLTLVRSYEYLQQEWVGGIDTCDADILLLQKRPVYFGWRFIITSLRGDVYEARVSFDLKAVTVCDEVQAPVAPVADASGDAAAAGNLPAPVAGAAALSGFSLGGHVDGLSAAAVSNMRTAGMTWVKKQLRTTWGGEHGVAYIEDAHSKGFKILLGVVGNSEALATNFDTEVSNFSAFLAELAAAGADAIEVWNEPNIDREWPAGQINGASYTKLLASAYNAIKAANPNTLVISGAPAPTGFFGAAGCGTGGCNDDVFMQQMASAGAAQYMDCVGLHYNEGIVSPATNSGDPRGEYPTYYFSSMLARGYAPFGGKSVCFTELGYLSPQGFGSLPAAFGWAGNVTVADQSAWLADAATRAAQSGKVSLMIVWNVNFTRFDTDPMGGYAIMRPDGDCPACRTLGAVMGS